VESIKNFNGITHLLSAFVSLIKNAWSCISTPRCNFMICCFIKNSHRIVFTLHPISRNFAPGLSLKMDILLLFGTNCHIFMNILFRRKQLFHQEVDSSNIIFIRKIWATFCWQTVFQGRTIRPLLLCYTRRDICRQKETSASVRCSVNIRTRVLRLRLTALCDIF
jgi:hypothetical protein